MIESMHIKNFKCFKDFKLEGLSRINLIGGKNNVGKTALLEAIWLLPLPANPGLFHQLLNLRSLPIRLDPEWLWGQVFQDVKGPLAISVKDGGFTKNLVLNVQLGLGIELGASLTDISSSPIQNVKATLEIDDSVDNGFHQKIRHVLSLDNKVTTQLDFSKNPSVPSILISYVSSRNHSIAEVGKYSALNNDGRGDEVLELIKIVAPEIKDLSVSSLPGEPSLMYAGIQESTNKVPLSRFGDGVHRAFSLITTILNCKNGIVLIDEIENGFHYSVMPAIFKALAAAAEKMSCQIFATTHSYECLEAARESLGDKPGDFKYIRLDRLDDNIVATTYSNEGFARSIEHEWELR